MVQNFSSWECDACKVNDRLTYYTVANVSSLRGVLNFPDPPKDKMDKMYASVTVPSSGDIDEIDAVMEIRHKMVSFVNVKFDVKCDDKNYTDWKHDWEVVEDQGAWPKVRVYIYGVNGFLPNYLKFEITATVRLS